MCGSYNTLVGWLVWLIIIGKTIHKWLPRMKWGHVRFYIFFKQFYFDFKQLQNTYFVFKPSQTTVIHQLSHHSIGRHFSVTLSHCDREAKSEEETFLWVVLLTLLNEYLVVRDPFHSAELVHYETLITNGDLRNAFLQLISKLFCSLSTTAFFTKTFFCSFTSLYYCRVCWLAWKE